MFKENDVVFYGIQGVCRVQSIEIKRSEDVETSYYVLAPVLNPTSCIYVPTENAVLTERMKPVMSKDEVLALIDSIPAMEKIWVPEPNARKERFKNVLLSGDRYQIGALIKTLYAHRKEQQSKGKKLHIADERYLKEAEKALCSEFAVTLEKRMDEVAAIVAERFGK